MAFAANLDYYDFRQEGHRVEFKDTENLDAGLEYKGVVYNEMKGVVGDPQSAFMYKLNEHLFEKSQYRFNSGGDPRFITDLTYDDLKSFHADYYHPTNGHIFTYGDLDFTKHLEFIEEQVLANYEVNWFWKIKRFSQSPKQKLSCRTRWPRLTLRLSMVLVMCVRSSVKIHMRHFCLISCLSCCLKDLIHHSTKRLLKVDLHQTSVPVLDLTTHKDKQLLQLVFKVSQKVIEINANRHFLILLKRSLITEFLKTYLIQHCIKLNLLPRELKSILVWCLFLI